MISELQNKKNILRIFMVPVELTYNKLKFKKFLTQYEMQI